MFAAIVANHREERKAWRQRLAAEPSPPAEPPAGDDVPWPEAPTRDEHGEPVSARAPPAAAAAAGKPALAGERAASAA